MKVEREKDIAIEAFVDKLKRYAMNEHVIHAKYAIRIMMRANEAQKKAKDYESSKKLNTNWVKDY